jgi:hypothetical protein
MANEQSFADRSKLVDLNDSGLFAGDTVTLNFDSDAWAYPAPPPMGNYDLKLFPAKEFVKMVKRDETKPFEAPGNVYYQANLECRIVAPGQDWDNTPVFATVSTIVGRGRELSTMIGVVRLTGAIPKKNTLSDLEQVKILHTVLKKEPIIRGVFLDWEGYSKNDKKSVCKSMTDFPKAQDGTYQHSFTRIDSQRDKEEITAQLRVKSWVNRNTSTATELGQGTLVSAQVVSAPAPSPAPQMAIPDAMVGDLEDLLA